jgi:hypothetical protein
MAFGAAQPAGEDSERYESRNLTIVSGEEKSTQTGKVYWRVKDSANKYYSVWDETVKINLETAAGKNESIACAVQIQTKADGKTFYSITGTGAAAEGLVQAGAAKAQAATKPGGKYSEYGKRMHPDDALRVTNLALIERALHHIEIIIQHDCPEGMPYDQFVKGKLMPTMQFMNGVIDLPKTLTPDAPLPKAEEAPATQQAAGFGPAPDPSYGDDSDIPF